MSTADELEKLHRLLQGGALTQAEFDAAKARLLAGDAPDGGPSSWAINRLRRDEANGWIAGVCSGIARLTGVEAWIWRLIFVAGLMLGGFTAILYIVLWIFVPPEHA